MAWKETRGSSRVVLAAARQVAHADDAKARADEATRLPARSLRPRVLAGAGVAVIVLALVAFLAPRGGADDETHAAALVKTTPSASTTPIEPTPADVLEESHPSGAWKLIILGRTTTTRGGTTSPLKGKADPVTWTFPAASCSDTQCSGTISSSSGREFPFSWDGRRLEVTRTGLVERGKRQACVDVDTGEPRPIETSADRITYRYSYGPFTGGPDRMTAKATTRISYEWFGDCEPHATDTVRETYAWVLTPIDRT